MKRHGIFLMGLMGSIFTASFALAAFEIPGTVFRIDQLQQAKEEAKVADQQIVFLYSNKDTDCPLTSKASIRIMQKFKNSAVIVYICREDWAKVPRIVKQAISSTEAGRFIPKTVVVDSDITKVVSIIPYERAGK